MLHILQVDRAGAPVDWLTVEEAAYHEAKGNVAWSLGEPCRVLRGGINAKTGKQSTLELRPVISVIGDGYRPQNYKTPTLSRPLLFRRDRHLCAYCGERFKEDELTMDHIQPKSREGADSWMNLVAACKYCNHTKANRTPEEAGMPLLYVPYVPNIYETFILKNRKILADQLEFLLQSVPKHSRLHGDRRWLQ